MLKFGSYVLCLCKLVLELTYVRTCVHLQAFTVRIYYDNNLYLCFSFIDY